MTTIYTSNSRVVSMQMAATFQFHKSISRFIVLPALARRFATRQRQHVNPLALKFHVRSELPCSDVWYDMVLEAWCAAVYAALRYTILWRCIILRATAGDVLIDSIFGI